MVGLKPEAVRAFLLQSAELPHWTQAYAASTNMALLGFSHAASEYLVMEAQMAGWFRGRGLRVECLPQADWWR